MSADPGEVVMEGVGREAAGHERRVVDAHDGVEQHLLQPNVEVRLQSLENDVIVRHKSTKMLHYLNQHKWILWIDEVAELLIGQH